MSKSICLTPFLSMPPEQAQRLLRQLLQSGKQTQDLTNSTESKLDESTTSTSMQTPVPSTPPARS